MEAMLRGDTWMVMERHAPLGLTSLAEGRCPSGAAVRGRSSIGGPGSSVGSRSAAGRGPGGVSGSAFSPGGVGGLVSFLWAERLLAAAHEVAEKSRTYLSGLNDVLTG